MTEISVLEFALMGSLRLHFERDQRIMRPVYQTFDITKRIGQNGKEPNGHFIFQMQGREWGLTG